MTDTDQHTETDGSTGERLDRLEAAVDRIEQAVTALAPTHEQAEQHTEARLDRGTTMAEHAKAELAKLRQQEKAEQEKADADAAARAEKETTQQRLAKLEEAPPAPPVRRATKMLGWGDGR